MPGDSGGPVVTNARASYTTRAAAGALGIRHSLRPLFRRGTSMEKLARITQRECDGASEVINVIARSVSDEAIHLLLSRGNGLLRFARNDGPGAV